MNTIVKLNDKTGAANHVEVLVDSSSDLTALAGKVTPGSIAYTADLANVWMLNNNHEWVAVVE